VKIVLKFTWLLLFLCLSGCQMLSSGAPVSVALKLLPPAQGPSPVLLKQVVTLEAKGQRRQFLVVARLQATGVEMVALMPTGQRLMTLSYDGEELRQQQLSSIPLPGEDILAILQFSLWPEASVKQHYSENDGWLIMVKPDKRQLLKSSQLLLEVDYEEQQLVVEQYVGNYRVLIKTLERTAL
jgi:hypothetical protein